MFLKMHVQMAGGGEWDGVLCSEVGLDKLVLCDFQVVAFGEAARVTLRDHVVDSSDELILSERLPVFVRDADDGSGVFGEVLHPRVDGDCVLVRVEREVRRVPLERLSYNMCAFDVDATIDSLPDLLRARAWKVVTTGDGSEYLACDATAPVAVGPKLSKQHGFRKFMVFKRGTYLGGKRGDFPRCVTRDWQALTEDERLRWSAEGPSAPPPPEAARSEQTAVQALLHLSESPDQTTASRKAPASRKRTRSGDAAETPPPASFKRTRSGDAAATDEETPLPATARTFDEVGFRTSFGRVLRLLQKYKEAAVFCSANALPFDRSVAGLRKYARVVPSPQCLRRVSERLRDGAYGTDVASLRADLDLVWANALRWSEVTEDRVLAACARRMRAHATAHMNDLLASNVSIPCRKPGRLASEPRCLLRYDHPGICIFDASLLPADRKCWMPPRESCVACQKA